MTIEELRAEVELLEKNLSDVVQPKIEFRRQDVTSFADVRDHFHYRARIGVEIIAGDF